MRYLGVTLATSVIVLSACGGGEKPADQSSTPAPAASAPPAAAPGAAGTAQPVTGKTIEVKMVGDDKGMRFEPANITAKVGDGIKFVVVSGVPHNIAFDPATIPADVKAQLDANFGTDRMAELSSNLKMNPGDAFTLSLGGIKPGKYDFHCTPHTAMNMKGTITVTP